MRKNYVDYKMTVWNRFYFDENADMKSVLDRVHKEFIPDELCDQELGFLESEMLYDTEDFLLPCQNGNSHTMEVYENDIIIGDNKYVKYE